MMNNKKERTTLPINMTTTVNQIQTKWPVTKYYLYITQIRHIILVKHAQNLTEQTT